MPTDRALGRRPPKNAPALRLSQFLTGQIPAHPLAANYLSQVHPWMLGANDRFGTCGPTYCANTCVLVFKALLGQSITVTDTAVFDLYRRSGNPDFDPATGAGDRGVDMQTMLEAWHAGGLEVTHADGTTEVVKPVAFAKVDLSNIDEVRAAVAIFGSTGWGVNLENAQKTQTDAGGPWDYRRSGVWGGHAVLAGAYTSNAARGAPDISVVTWAEVMGTTDAFAGAQLEEAWVVILPAHLDHLGFLQGVDLTALADAYQKLTGRPLPLPAPTPPPGPPPAPQPGPAPQPPVDLVTQVEVFLRGLVTQIQAFLQKLGG